MKTFSRTFLLLLLIVAVNKLFAQKPAGYSNSARNLKVGQVYGKLLDETNGKPVDGASVQLLLHSADSSGKIKKDQVIALKVSDRKGEFSIDNLPVSGNFTLLVTALGFLHVEKKLSFEANSTKNSNRDNHGIQLPDVYSRDMGNIKLSIDIHQLRNITVNASKHMVGLELDRKVYNVDKDLQAAGGTAEDVLKNVPSVMVDIDGNVTLRNGAPQLFVDGRPTTLSADQIPADQIATIEVITNPSARFDAGNGGAGILNIVLKKNRRSGYNGNIRAGVDSRARPGTGGNINIRQGKINLFAAGMFNMRKTVSNVHTDRTDFGNTYTALISQQNNPANRGSFAFGRLGADYFISNRTTLTISGSLMRAHYRSEDMISLSRDSVKATETVSESGKRYIMAINDFWNYAGNISFRHNFTRPGKELTADINYSYNNNFNVSDYNSRYSYMNGSADYIAPAERSTGGGKTNFITFQSDLENPFGNNRKLEAGIRVAYRYNNSNNDNFLQNQAGMYDFIDALHVNFRYHDMLYAAYATYSMQEKNVSILAGLRAERSRYDAVLVTGGQRFSNSFPVSLFPSLSISHKPGKHDEMQLNYSRKVNRPFYNQLIPFIDFSDSLNLIAGNPGLKPEFTNLLELSYLHEFNSSVSLLANLYGRYTGKMITRYLYKGINPNPAKTDSVLFTSFTNAGSSYNYGIELTGQIKPAKWWDLATNFNFFHVIIDGSEPASTAKASQFSWFAKANNSFRLPAGFTVQLTGEYQSKSIVPVNSGSRGGYAGGSGGMYGGGMQPTAQGFTRPLFYADLALRFDFMKNNAASLILQVSDIFRTRLFDSRFSSPYFIQDYSRRRDPQLVRLNFNWRFGKFDVSLVKRRNMKGEAENMPVMQQP